MRTILLPACFCLLAQICCGQTIIGLWEITSVTVGDRNMTPVAKWTRINEDNTFQNGNGWLQNAEGTWTYNENTMQFRPEQKNGLRDDFGPFTVAFSDEGMSWTRMEEGMTVTVSLAPASEIPKGPADRIVGLWEPVDHTVDNRSYLFIRWDRLYLEGQSDGSRKSGYWHINGHKPEVTLLPHHGAEPETWRIEVGDTELTMTGISDSNRDLVRRFVRIDRFPN